MQNLFVLIAKYISQNVVQSKWPTPPLTVLTDNRIKFSAKFGFLSLNIWWYQNMAQHNCDLFTNIFFSPMPIANAYDIGKDSLQEGSKKVYQAHPADIQISKIFCCQKVVCKFNLTCSGDEENVSLWRFTIKATLLESAKTAVVIVVFGRVGGLVCGIILLPNISTKFGPAC